MQHRYIGVLSLLLALVCTGCRDRYFRDRDAAIRHLQAHQQEFEELAEAWASGAPEHPTVFCNFKPGNLRWGQVFIRQTGEGFTVETNGNKYKATSLQEAAKSAGVPFAGLSRLGELTTKYRIYCLENGSEGTVQILLAGSDWSPYGFRYAPRANVRGLDTLVHYARQGGMENSDTRMAPISGRWFYFEAKR